MRPGPGFLLAAVACLSAVTARADGGGLAVDLEKECPAAVREHEQLLRAQPPPKPVKAVERPALRAELLQTQDQDQAVREALIAAMKNGTDLPEHDPVREQVRAVDARNLRRLKSIVALEGLPTARMVGTDGVAAMFLLVAHIEDDLAFQEEMLTVFAQRVRTGEISGSQFALLTDKVLRAQGKPQRYGTQFDDALQPQPMEDAAHVDERRHAMGMVSMANYTCEMHAIYGAGIPGVTR